MAGDGEDIFGGSDMEREAMVPGTPGAAKTPKTSKRPRGGQDDREMPVEGLCDVCLCVTDGEAGNKQWRGLEVHAHCYNGIRCYQRMCKTKKAKEEELRRFTVDRASWRSEVLPLVVKPGGVRSVHVRESARAAIVQESAEVSGEITITDSLFLTKSRFRGYMKQWEGWNSDECSSEFEKEYEAQKTNAVDKTGQRLICVQDNIRVRKFSGQEDKKVQRDAPYGCAQSSRSDFPDESSSAPSTIKRSPFKRARAGESPPSRSSAVGIGHRGDRAGGDGGRAALTEARLRRHTSRADEDEDDDGRSETGLSLAMSAGGSGKTSVVQFMRQKKELKVEAEALVAATQSRSGVMQRIKTAMAKLGEKDLTVEGCDPTATTQEIADVLAKLKRWQTEFESTNKGSIQEMRDKFQDIKGEVEAKTSSAEEVYDALKFLIGQGAEASRKTQMHARYLRDKLVNKVVGGGGGREQAKRLSVRLQDMSKQDEFIVRDPKVMFDLSKVAVWNVTDAGDGDMGIIGGVMKFRTGALNLINAKVDSLKANMVANGAWGGALARVSGINTDTKPILKEFGIEDALREAGCDPWIACMRKYSSRWGANCWPMPGLGSFVAVEGQPGAVLQLFKAAPLVSQGLVVLGDLPGFLETASGGKLMKGDAWLVIDMRHGSQILWIPYGYMCAPVFIPAEVEDDAPHGGTKNKSTPPQQQPVAFMYTWTIFSPMLAHGVDDGTWAAIEKFNMNHIDKLKTHALWAERGQLLSKLSAGRAGVQSSS